jgi:hypothetical protein
MAVTYWLWGREEKRGEAEGSGGWWEDTIQHQHTIGVCKGGREIAEEQDMHGSYHVCVTRFGE